MSKLTEKIGLLRSHHDDEPDDTWTWSKFATISGTVLAVVSIIISALLDAQAYSLALDFSHWTAEKDYLSYCLELRDKNKTVPRPCNYMLNTTLPLPPNHDPNFWLKGGSGGLTASAVNSVQVPVAGSGSLSPGSIVGIAIGSIAGVIVLLGLGLVSWKCYRRHSQQDYIVEP